jgi:Mg-chelatase subunit ChlD
VSGCGDGRSSRKPDGAPTPADSAVRPANWIELPQTELKAGTAVAVLVDTSGSMAQTVRDAEGKQRPKHELAKAALKGILDYTADWKKKHADRTLNLGIYEFSSRVSPVLAMSEFDQAKAQAALERISKPNSGTAIGRGLEQGFRALYQSGCVRKYVVCITDGINTSGPSPEQIARQLYQQTKGDVEINFVAFDVSAKRFQFLNDVNGRVVEAADGKQLQTELSKIYEKRILVEAEIEGDAKPSSKSQAPSSKQ